MAVRLLCTNILKVTWKSGADTVVRGQFVDSQELDSTADTDFRAVNDNW